MDMNMTQTKNSKGEDISVVMIGGTGAVGGQVVAALCESPAIARITLLGRSEATGVTSAKVRQHIVDVLSPTSYEEHLHGHQAAISTLGVGQPSKMSKEDFTRIDKDAVVHFASAAKAHGVRHFQSLGSVGTNRDSRNFYLRTKGQLEHELGAIGFERLSLFHPSMILTPSNRYGFMQGITLKVWPILGKLFFGPLSKLRGIRTSELGRAFAGNLGGEGEGVETLEWSDFVKIARRSYVLGRAL